MIEVNQPRLYLDFEGVILPFGRADNTQFPFEMTEISGFEYYSPEVVNRLGQTGLELVWCTPLDRDQEELVDAIMDGLPTSRFLAVPDIGVGAAERVLIKLDALIADQAEHSQPFVWADDAITDEARDRVAEESSGIPYLLVAPDKEIGINEDELIAIEQFAGRLELAR